MLYSRKQGQTHTIYITNERFIKLLFLSKEKYNYGISKTELWCNKRNLKTKLKITRQMLNFQLKAKNFKFLILTGPIIVACQWNTKKRKTLIII